MKFNVLQDFVISADLLEKISPSPLLKKLIFMKRIANIMNLLLKIVL